jgi:hypothetical protein
MTLTFRSSIPEEFKIVGRDTSGRERVATARREPGAFNWNMNLQHPSGRSWQATYHGEAVIDALGELLCSKDGEFKQDKARGDRPHTAPFDGSRRVENMPAPIIGNTRMR